MSEPVVFPFEYFESRISQQDVEDFRKSGASEVYISLISGRCGSTLFSHFCKNVNFGNGEEPFNERPYGEYAFYAPDDIREFVQHSIDLSSIEGRYYFQLNAQRFHYFSKMFAPGVLEGWITRISLILRRNIVSQAISLATAIKTGLWHRFTQSDAHHHYDLPDTEILDCIEQIHNQELLAFALCKHQQHTLVLFYEDIASAALETVTLFMSDCGYAPPTRERAARIASSTPSPLPKNPAIYANFMHRHPDFQRILSGRLMGDIPSHAIPEALNRARMSPHTTTSIAADDT